jgi:hypothetical protein
MPAMALRSALAGAITTAGLVAVLGNPAVVDRVTENGDRGLGATLVRFADWDVFSAPGDVVRGAVLRLVVVVLAVALLAALVKRDTPRGAAFLAGWAALVVAAAIAGAANYVYVVEALLDGRTLGPSYVDGLVQEVNGAASFGLWTGWMVGAVLAILMVTRPATAPAPAPAPQGTAPWGTAPWGTAPPPPADRAYGDPPAPWWAPTRVDDHGAVVQPGPSVFPPGGLPHPGPPAEAPAPAPASATTPAPGATHEMTTASGDPHPSDPDATQAVGLPSRPVGETPEPDDPEATTTMDAASPDRTMPIPRQPD